MNCQRLIILIKENSKKIATHKAIKNAIMHNAASVFDHPPKPVESKGHQIGKNRSYIEEWVVIGINTIPIKKYEVDIIPEYFNADLYAVLIPQT